MNILRIICLTLCFSFGCASFGNLFGSPSTTKRSVRNTLTKNLCDKGGANVLSRTDFCDDFTVIFPDGTVAQDIAALTDLQALLAPDAGNSDVACSEEETTVTNLKLSDQSSLTRGLLYVSFDGNAPATTGVTGDFCGRYLCEVEREDGRQKICRCSLSGLVGGDATAVACAAI